MSNENDRKNFEVWAEPRGFMIESYQGSTGEWFFSDDDTQLNFECWQAAIESYLDFGRCEYLGSGNVGPTQKCDGCGQVDTGQTGEYPCKLCGLPILHDDPGAEKT